jgi:hypothetical protein
MWPIRGDDLRFQGEYFCDFDLEPLINYGRGDFVFVTLTKSRFYSESS